MTDELITLLAQLESIASPDPGFEHLRILLIGSPNGVNHAIHDLHICNFTSLNNWSRELIAPFPDAILRVALKTHPRS